MLKNEESKIVGWLGNLPSAYHFRGRELISASVSPWVVDESYRSHSVLLLEQFTGERVSIYSSTVPPDQRPAPFHAFSVI